MNWFDVALGAGGGGLITYLVPKAYAYLKAKVIAWANGNDHGVQ